MARNELVSLGLIYDAPKHVYALNAIIKDIGLEHWATISRTSIYNTLSRLKNEGCVKVTAQQVGNMPPRKVYGITARGRRRLRDEQAAALRSCGTSGSLFYLAVTFLFGMPAAEAVEHCGERIALLRQLIEHLDEEGKSCKECDIASAVAVIRAARKHVKVEIEATKELIALLQRDPECYDTLLVRMKKHYGY